MGLKPDRLAEGGEVALRKIDPFTILEGPLEKLPAL